VSPSHLLAGVQVFYNQCPQVGLIELSIALNRSEIEFRMKQVKSNLILTRGDMCSIYSEVFQWNWIMKAEYLIWKLRVRGIPSVRESITESDGVRSDRGRVDNENNSQSRYSNILK